MSTLRSKVSTLVMAALSIAGSAAFASPASADTSGGTGVFQLIIETCIASVSSTNDSVWLTLQADGRMHRRRLNNDGDERRNNSTDTYRFSWPTSIGSLSELEQIKLEKSGTDDWCISRIQLKHHNDMIFSWRSTDPGTNRRFIDGRNGGGTITLNSREPAKAAFVRFTDASVRGWGNTYPFGAARLWAETCSALRGENVGTEAGVQFHVMHDGVGDVIAAPAGTFSDAGSDWFISEDNAGVHDRPVEILTGAHVINSVKVVKPSGDDWCVERVGMYYPLDGGLAFPEENTEIFETGRATLAAGNATHNWAVNATAYRCSGNNCPVYHFGYPLQASANWNDENVRFAETPETCNGVDDNHDGQIDEGLTIPTWYRDADGDGVGVATQTTRACRVPVGYSPLSTDCNDNNNLMHPMRSEVCDGLDNNCSGRVDEGVSNACGTCGGAPAEVCDNIDNDCDGLLNEGFAGIPEICNGIDDNCNGLVDLDDPTVQGLNACGGCGPAPQEVCDAVDNDCDGLVDGAPSDVNTCGVCGPQPVELCNGADDDCNGQVDENYSEARFCGVGVCSNTGAAVCVEGEIRDLCTPLPPQGDDYDCNGLDDDCDGLVDEHFVPMEIVCTEGCGTGMYACQDGHIVNTCEACESR